MQASVYDLFGEVPVYRHDIDAWLLAVPRISPDSPRAPAYIRSYDVVGKIQRFKVAGTFEATVQRVNLSRRASHWWERFSWGRYCYGS